MYKHVSQAVKRFQSEVLGRREGKVKSLKTSSYKLNKVSLNGFEWNKIITLAGMSGTGKSMILEQWKRDFFYCNPDESFEVLAFEFEMLPEDQILRSVSSRTGLNRREILSIDRKLNDEEYQKIIEESDKLGKYPIFYISTFCTVDMIRRSINDFIKNRKLFEKGKGLIVTLDHTLLTAGKQGENETQIIKDLYHTLVDIKKNVANSGNRILFIILSQLNRDVMKSTERITNPRLHYPQESDIFGSSHVVFGSDYVIISHKPSKIPGILHYGVPTPNYPQGLPIRTPDNKHDMIYWHVIKNRGGKPATLMMEERFDLGKIKDFIPEDYEQD